MNTRSANKKITKSPAPRKSAASLTARQTADFPHASSPTECPVFSMDGKKVGTVTLPTDIFNALWKPDLVHQVTTAIQANLRQNRAHTKDRSEVSGGGKKPWKQKGTGRARHGSSRSPIWRHGGITFGPRSTRSYSEKVNKKMRTQALLSALSKKLKDKEIIFVDKIAFIGPKTGLAKAFMLRLAKESGESLLATKKKNSAIFALSSYNVNTVKSFNNIGSVATEEVRNINPLQILSYKYLIIENPEASIKILAERGK